MVSLKPKLKNLNATCYSGIEVQTVEAEQVLAKLQAQIIDDPHNNSLINMDVTTMENLRGLMKARDSFLRQKAKALWTEEGDINSAYFHGIIKKRCMRNTIIQIENQMGTVCNDSQAIQNAFLEYYIGLLGSRKETEPVQNIVLGYGKACTDEHIVLLNQPVTYEEVKQVIFSIPIDKAPGPDGYTSGFYKDSWELIGHDIVAAVKDFFKDWSICPRKIHYRKCPDLPRYSSPIFKEKCLPRMSIQDRLQKAYDLVEWDFVEQLLIGLRFPIKFVSLIMACIRTTSYTLVLNGNNFGYFQDGLSIIILCAKGSNLPIDVSLMIFDVLKGDAPSILLLMRAFTSFSNASGLQMNATKSEIFFNGMNEELQLDLLYVTGFQKGKMPFRYLGVPIQPGKVSKKDCNSLVEKMVARIRSLGAKKLSYAGRVVLINSVLNTLYNYWAAMNFLWDSSTEYHRVPLVGWDKVTRPKTEGGLGIKKAEVWNLASVGKLVNWIYTKPDRLWIKWVDSIYLKGANWQDYTPPADSTWTWKSICKVKNKIKNGFIDNCWAPHHKGYIVSNGYDWLMGPYPQQTWATMVWSNWNIPKHSFISWVIMQEGLNTKSKLHAYGYCQDALCILCEEQAETSTHLFEYCIFSCKVKQCIEDWTGRAFPTVNEIQSANGNRMQIKDLALILTAFRYAIWYHRNSARHNLCVFETRVGCKALKELVQQRIRSKAKEKDGITDLNIQARLGFM
ncbi:uncharacterized protein LOC141632073 [Silene latifolia]|uniref:uncharacterized protein LOC141632073 n=1 Tax=Silene latifolia TaxID=37657 RepID=UPI003D772623